MSDLSTLKEEILEWANKPGSMKKFTTHDVYDAIHSAETPSKTSDTLRVMWKYDKTLDREEFMDGNRKKFIYSLANVKVDKIETKVDKEITNVDKKVNVKLFSDVAEEEKPKEDLGCVNYLTIPNNFTIELRTPSGFVITIKSSDLKE